MRLRVLGCLLAVSILAALAVRAPLLAVPSYEAGLLFGAAAAIGTCWLAFARARLRPRHVEVRWGLLVESPGQRVLAETRANLLAGAALVGLPLGLLAATAATTGCRVAPGVPTCLLVAAPAVLAGAALGTFAGSVTRRPLHALALVAGVVLATVGLTAWEGWVGPRHVLHHAILGPISVAAYTGYDDTFGFPGSVLAHRAAWILAWSALLLAAAVVRTWTDAPGSGRLPAEDDAGWGASRADDPTRARFLLGWHRRRGLRAGAALAAAAVPFLAMADASGLLPGRGRLERRLPAVAATANVRVHHDPDLTAASEVARLAVEHEWALRQVCGWLGLEPRPVDVYLHPDERTLHELTGARGYVFAAPWNREIHLHAGQDARHVLRHELVHVIAADFGGWPLRASSSTALIEGLATALDEGYVRAPEAHESVAAAAAAGHVPPARSLVSLLGFASGTMDRSYRASASFCGWLLHEHGAEAFRRAYPWGRLEASYGRSLDDLDASWRRFLADEVRPDPAVAARARARFDPRRRPAFSALPCPRLGTRAGDPAAGARLHAAAGDHEEAAERYCEAWRLTADPLHLEAAAGQALQAGQADRALELVEQALRRGRVPEERRDGLLEQRFLLLARLERLPEARQALADWREAGLAPRPEILALEESALAAPEDVRGRWHEARLAPRGQAIRLLAALLEETPAFAPALHLLLLRELDAPGPPAPDLPALAERFVAASPETPGLAAWHFVLLARQADRAGRWEESARRWSRALELPGLRPLERLEAQDGLDRARMAPAVAIEWLNARGAGADR